ncbi:MAG: molybdopterin-dependent oxidoreductase [FCB group bacterium]|jgi:NADH-quinone oxidoreductase subunit G
MPHIVIDGKLIEARTDETIIQAALENNILITHYCWHPELSVAGNCRMCLVEVGLPKRLPDGTNQLDAEGKPVINYFPKLQIACATPVSEGMHVRTISDTVIKAQEAVMEFLLINHPLDCPICDEAGQCKLQEYAFLNSSAQSRFEEEKVHAPKRVPWGQNILFDGERCIKCSRCIRFAQEIAKQDVLTFVNRGDHVTIEQFEGKEFDNPYSMNVIDLCPVGALTSKDFRFKSRVWDMSFNDSICPGCGRGCNIKLGVRNNQILRVEPRTNNYVNKYWMCDYGRLSHHKLVNENRVDTHMIRWKGDLINCSRDEAYSTAADSLKKFEPNEIMFLGSAKATNEDNYLLARFAKEIIGSNNLDFLRHIDTNFADDFLKVNEKAPNFAGAIETGVVPGPGGVSIEELADAIRFGKIKALYMMEDDLSDFRYIRDELDRLSLLIVHGSNLTKTVNLANVVFSSSTYAEVEGTFTNIENRVQHFTPALVTAENMRTMGMKMSRLDKFGAANDRWTQHKLLNCRPNWRIITRLSQQLNSGWDYKNSRQVFDEIAEKIPSFKGMSYELLDEFRGIQLGKASEPDAKVFIYESNYLKPH